MNINNENILLVIAVFDGHGGSEVSNYIRN